MRSIGAPIDCRLSELDVAGIVRLTATVKDSRILSFVTLDNLGPTWVQ